MSAERADCYTLEIWQSSFAEPSRAGLCEAVPPTGRSDVHHRGSADQWIAAGGTLGSVTRSARSRYRLSFMAQPTRRFTFPAPFKR
jgi:hypothetical protein